MDSKGLRQHISILMGMALVSISLAQEPAAGQQAQGQVQRPSVFGTQTNILQIPGAAFVPRRDTVLGSTLDGYIYALSSVIPDFAWAPVMLPSGVDLDFLDLYYCDNSSSYDLTARLVGYYGWNDSNIGHEELISVSSVGSDGCDYRYAPGPIRPDGIIPPGFDHTINNDVRYGDGYQYAILVDTPTPQHPGLQFKGVDIWYHRQVSPAPGTATFTDVPTGHAYFRFIEALAASGITAGCGGGNYCPGNPLTRGEMAVFLAKALGLHFPN
jgi:hypothetical protein